MSSSEGPLGSDSSDDATLKMLNAKRLLELKRRASVNAARQGAKAAAKQPKRLSDRELLLSVLVERGDEVLYSAEASYPNEMRILIPKLAELIRDGKIAAITGGELLQFLRAVGMRVSVATSISVVDHGKLVSLSDKLKQQKED
jgi:DNA-binding TFAR19-related protein (PDSD5 family)